MKPYEVNVGDADFSREAIYTRMEGKSLSTSAVGFWAHEPSGNRRNEGQTTLTSVDALEPSCVRSNGPIMVQ